MEHEDTDAVLSAFDWGCKGGTAESCMTCKKLLDAAYQIVEKSIRKARHRGMEAEQEGDREVVVNLGRLVDILSDPQCEDHEDFFRAALYIRKDAESLDIFGCPKEELQVQLRWNEQKDRAILVKCSPDSYTEGDIMLLNSESDKFGLPCMERLRDDDFISTGLMREWISTCEQHHSSTCYIPTSPSTPLSWMIDTISGCLVPAVECTRYVALSYVWGQTEMLKTTTETVEALQECGALDTNTSLDIPAVIRHAISLLPQLGERYLWVDSLCITQDDSESLNRHIRHMASIYEAALFTIVAADGIDANHGIPGIRGVSTARKLSPSLPLTSRLRLRPRRSVNILNSPWGSRGWTLQEHVFSRKKLVFFRGSVQWICQEYRCFEDSYQQSPSIRKKKRRDHDIDQELESVGDLSVQYPMISQIGNLLSQYTSRRLTHQHDILNAIDAVFTAHHQAFPHGFFWGLPLDYFDMAMLWTCTFGYKTTERRQESSSSSQSHFPSWTWAGRIGKISYLQWSAESYIKQADEAEYGGVITCQTIPICEWREWSGNPDSSKLPIPGQNSAYAYKQMFMGKKVRLPDGWKYEDELFGPRSKWDMWRYDTPGGDARGPRGSNWALETPYYYSHEAASGVKFWHPVPISIDPPSHTSTPPTNGGLLCAKTRSGRLWVTSAKDHPAAWPHGPPFKDIGRVFVNLFNGNILVETVLINQKGGLVGDLNIDGRSDRDMVKNYECHPDEAGYPCDLVAISRGNDFVHPMEPEKEIYTLYNVLWVEWEDGIAYRRGVGRVKREIWESMELEDIDLVLG